MASGPCHVVPSSVHAQKPWCWSMSYAAGAPGPTRTAPEITNRRSPSARKCGSRMSRPGTANECTRSQLTASLLARTTIRDVG